MQVLLWRTSGLSDRQRRWRGAGLLPSCGTRRCITVIFCNRCGHSCSARRRHSLCSHEIVLGSGWVNACSSEVTVPSGASGVIVTHLVLCRFAVCQDKKSFSAPPWMISMAFVAVVIAGISDVFPG